VQVKAPFSLVPVVSKRSENGSWSTFGPHH
jgi:hypothetical protein